MRRILRLVLIGLLFIAGAGFSVRKSVLLLLSPSKASAGSIDWARQKVLPAPLPTLAPASSGWNSFDLSVPLKSNKKKTARLPQPQQSPGTAAPSLKDDGAATSAAMNKDLHDSGHRYTDVIDCLRQCDKPKCPQCTDFVQRRRIEVPEL